jgi:hypothetical protein
VPATVPRLGDRGDQVFWIDPRRVVRHTGDRRGQANEGVRHAVEAHQGVADADGTVLTAQPADQ